MADLGDKVSAEDKAAVEAEIANTKKALEGSDISAIKEAADKLQQKFYEISAKLYQQQTPPGGNASTGAGPDMGGGASGAGPDDAVDADYKTVDDDQ